MIKTVRTAKAILKSTLKASGAHHAGMNLKSLRRTTNELDTAIVI
jgi:hypothetical protein